MKKKKTLKAKTAKRAKAIPKLRFEEPMIIQEFPDNPMPQRIEDRNSLGFKAMQFLGLKI